MQELLDYSVLYVNIIPTIALLFCLLYWVIVMFGFLSMDSIDIDLSTDIDIDADIDIEADINGPDTGGTAAVGWLNSALTFFNLGQIPLMIFLSFLSLPMWFISMVANYYLSNGSFLISLLLLIPIFIVSLFLAKIFTQPFVKLFTQLTKGDMSTKSYIGKICRVILIASDEKKGQAEIKIEGSSYLINTKTQKGININKGENGLIIDFDENEKSYLIEPYHEI